jgi:hypothetical protein
MADPIKAAAAAVNKALKYTEDAWAKANEKYAWPDERLNEAWAEIRERLRPLAAAVGASRDLTSLVLQESFLGGLPLIHLKMHEALQEKDRIMAEEMQRKKPSDEVVARRTALVATWIREDGTEARPPWQEYARRVKRDHANLYPEGKKLGQVADALRDRHRANGGTVTP